MRKIEVGFSKPINRIPLFGYVFSWCIRTIYRTKYSHVFVRWRVPAANTEVVYEASGTSVKFVNGDIFDKKGQTLHTYTLEISEQTYKRLLKYCLTNVGVSYGILQAIGIGAAYLLNLSSNPFNNGNRKQVCSELVANIIDENPQKAFGKDLDLVSPKDIKDFLDK
jgi:hypothetical protein